MSIATGEAAGRLDIGQTLQDLLNVLQRNLGTLALLGLLLAWVPNAMFQLGNALGQQQPAFILVGLVGLIAYFIARSILFGAVIFLAIRDLDGQPASLRECIAAGRRKWGGMLGLSIVSGLAIGVGLFLLIVPGVYLALRWAVAGPCMVLSGRGIADSMERSSRLTEGRRWSMFLFFLVVFAVLIVAIMLCVGVDGVLYLIGSKLLGTVLAGPLSNVLYDVTIPLAAAVIYRRLRDHAEGAPTAALEEVFA